MPGGLIDKGGAEMRRGTRQDMRDSFDRVFDRANTRRVTLHDPPLPEPPPFTGPSVTVEVIETHDGVKCDCIDKKNEMMVLRVGETIELTHTCHDGRVDVVRATVMSIDVPIEHAKIRKT